VTVITEPGVYEMSNEDYQADPVPDGSLSRSGARALLPPSCPALFAYQREHGRPPKAEFDFGHVAHRFVLGAGDDVVIIKRERWDTNEVKAQVAEARAAGKIPMRQSGYDVARQMADALLNHKDAAALFDPAAGTPERSLFWRDEEEPVWLRIRLDWLPAPTGGRMNLPDYKTCVRADRESAEKAMYQHGYHMQGDWAKAGVRALGLARDIEWLLVFQEKDPPYLVSVYQPDSVAMRIAAWKNRRAIQIYADCVKAGAWPGYSDGPQLLRLPGWAEARELQEMP
jgi:hypothetical protein